MLRTLGVGISMLWHFIINTPNRQKYSVEGKTLDTQKKKEYRTEVYRMMQQLSWCMIKSAGVEIEVKGKENLPKDGPAVYMSTHKGVYDSFILASQIEDTMIFIGKDETKKMFIISNWFNAMGCIYIVRDDIKQSMQAILDGIQELKDGQSIMIFPEGTRSKKLEMGEFKGGSFKLATKSGVPIVPIAVQNTHKILEEKGRIQKTKVYVNIGKPIEVKSLTKQEEKALPKLVENEVKRLLKEITP